MKYSVILFLLLCEFTFGQIPGSPRFKGTRNFPTVYTVSYTLSEDASSANVTAQVIKTGSLIAETGSPSPINVSGILWGETPPTITDFIGKTTDGRIDGQPFTSNALLPEQGRTLYVIAYATTAAGTFYGKLLTISQTLVVQSPFTFRYWMDRNLGATALPQSVTSPRSLDSTSMGGLYQWGRKSDGHEIVLPRSSARVFYSGTNPTRQANWAVVSNQFYTNGTGGGSGGLDWLLTSRNTLWQGLNGENNPCPTGFRVPTKNEFLNEINNFGTRTTDGAFTSFLRLPATGFRQADGLSSNYTTYTMGRYWTSTIIGTTTAYVLQTVPTDITEGTPAGRINGNAVRCIKGEASSGGNAVISGFTGGSSTGTLKLGEPASGVTKTIYANVTKAGSYSINTLNGYYNNGVVYSGQGTLDVGSNKIITLTATGTPTSQDTEGNWSYQSNTDPFFFFNTPLAGEPSTNGAAIVEDYTSISSQGDLFLSEDPTLTNVTQTIRANVTRTGTYYLKTTTNNGITFTANGTFTSLGDNDITLVATGTPISAGTYTFTLNTTPTNNFNRQVYARDPSTNGAAIVSGYTSISSQGELFTSEDPTLSNVTQTIRANVTRTGSYFLSTITNNGITFSANGTFTSIGNNDITLVATGTPISAGTYTFTLNTTPATNFNRQVYLLQNPSTNRKAIVSNYTSISSSGVIYRSSAVSNVTQTIRANVTKAGTYNLSTNTINGLKFAGEGIFLGTGNNDITLTATGTASSIGNYTYTTNTNPSVSFTRESGYISSGGAAIVSGYTNGQARLDQTPGIKQTINANVATPGTYNITTNIISGSRFVGTGTFTSTGNNSVTLTLTPTPTDYNGVYTFSLNTTPSATFSITNNSSSGGSALITWNGVSQSGLTTEERAENNRNIVRLTEASTYSPPFIQYIAVNVTQIGTYNIDAISNRNAGEGHTLRLVGSGTFTTTGVQTIPLYYYGQALNNNNGNPLNHYFYLPRESYAIPYYIIRNSQ